ncbi:MAG: response regulator, partial [Deltaproteobacteria bacterium]|nr:response regulator [Deltaproteobacteria bacterium]
MSFSEGPRFKPSSFRGAHIREIVLVEQDESLRSRLIQELRPHQIKVHGFSGSNEALPVLQRSSPDLLIVDVNVKPGDGFIFSQQVRQLKSAEELPILLTSNVIFRPEVLRAAKEEYGFSEFLGKPYTLQNLLAKLRQLGGSARPSPPPAQVAAAPEPYLFFLDQLGRVARDLRTGCLRCEREDLVAQLFFRSGKLVAVDCGKVSPEELGRTLVRRKLIHESQMELLLHELEGETGDRQHRLGLLLIEQGWLRAEQLAEVHAEQAADRFKQLFGRNEGSFRFVEDLAPGSGDLRFNFNLPSLVFEALCNHARLAQLRELVERYPGTVRVAAEATDALSGVKLSAGERRLVRKLNRKTILRSLSEVSEAGERGPVVVLLLLVLGLLEADSARGNELRMRIFGLVEQPRTGSAGAGAPAPENDTEAFDRAYGRGFRHMNMGLMGQAEEDFTRALQLKAGDARALCYLAWCHFHNCRSEEGFREALELNRQAAGADPKLLPVHLLRARMLLARGRRNEALSAAMRALELEPGSSEAKELLQELVRLPQESVAQPQADVPAARPAAAEEALFGRSPSPSTAPPPLPAAGSSTPAGAPSPASPTPTRAMLVAPPPAALAAQAPPAVAAPPAMAAPPEVAATASSARTASTAPAAAPIAAAKPPPAGPPPVLAVATPRASEVETGAEATDRAASGEGAARPVAAPAPPSAKPALGTAPRSTIEEWPSSEEQAGDPGPGAPAARQVVAAAAERVAGPANFTLLVLSLVQDEAALA